jgi:hypothetical protein
MGGCGASQKKQSSCPVTLGHRVVTPLTGRTVVLGRSPVLLELENRGNLLRGLVVLGLTGFPGWFGLKTHFLTPPPFNRGFTVRVRRLDGVGIVGIGGQPPVPGRAFLAPAGPAPNTANGWRDFPVPATWMRSAGCYEWRVTGHGFSETIVVHANLP